MSNIILYGDKLSPPVRTCMLVAEAIGLNLNFQLIDLAKSENFKESFLKINPVHCVPVLEDNGKFITDSHAIVTYLVSKYAKDCSLYPKDLYERALIDSKLHFDSGILYIRLREASMRVYLMDNPKIPESYIDAIYEGFDFMEKFLENSEFLCGPTMTLADLCCLCSITSSELYAPLSTEKYPKLLKWVNKLKSLPYYEKANGFDNQRYLEFLKDIIVNKNGSLIW